MRVALLSDLHGNEVALRAVLRDLDGVGVDRILCLGDTATLGPHPGAVLALLRERAATFILGNHDDFLLDPELIHSYTEAPIIVESVDWCRAQLSTEELAFVRSFVPGAELTLDETLDETTTLLLFHGTPRSHMEDLLATTPPDELDRFLDGRRATVMAGGHTHIQMLRQHRGLLLVNPGSVGLAFEQYVAGKPPRVLPHAEYAIVESVSGTVSVQLRRVALDKRALRAAASTNDNPLRPMLLQQYAD